MRPVVRRLFAGCLGVIAVFGSAVAANAQSPEVHQSRRPDYAANQLAIGGFDPVAYHTQRTAVAGNPQHRVSWRGAEWQFSSRENLELFVRDPDRYAPQYGGYCAFALARGGLIASDPRVFDLLNGKLYFNATVGTQSSWRRDTDGMIQRGDQNWPRVLGR